MADQEGVDDVVPGLYEELRGIASKILGRDVGGSIVPTSIVHEAYLRLSRSNDPRWKDRSHFLALAARCMRQVLVDHHRQRGAAKRGGDWQRVTLSGVGGSEIGADQAFDALALEELLSQLESNDPRQGRIVELRFFSGLSNAEIATELGISTPTVEREWRHARAWLARKMTP
jgi:RNA polymerase sigma-70 factor (ECF subfamily)